MNRISAVSFIATCLWFTSASAGFEDDKAPCSDYESKQIETALLEAIWEIETSADALEMFDDNTRFKFERWFGSSDDKAVIEVIEFYGGGEGLWDYQSAWCPTGADPDADYNNKAIAHVYTGEIIDMFFSPAFFKLPATGMESRASSVLHELMHSSGANLDPTSYTIEEAERLARSAPGNARRNAQNLEFFATDLVHGLR